MDGNTTQKKASKKVSAEKLHSPYVFIQLRKGF